jgi:hypothetical protein
MALVDLEDEIAKNPAYLETFSGAAKGAAQAPAKAPDAGAGPANPVPEPVGGLAIQA